tara:strand:- start:8394 stop:9368 length:975 start_codon:yes stop_codon:yes gene_type:complete
MPNILIYDSLHERAHALLSAEKDINTVTIPANDREGLLTALRDADALILRTLPFDSDCIDCCTKLKVIARQGVGFDNVDMDALNKKGIPLATIGDVNAVTVSELTLYFILAGAKQGSLHDNAVRNDNWKIRENALGIELFGKNALIIGFGRIGTQVAPRLKCFGTNIFVCDPYIDQRKITDSGFTAVQNWQDIVNDMDIITVHVPLNDETKLMINEEIITRLKRDAILINAARGPIVDSEAVALALDNGKLFAAGFDVFETEPPLKQSKILKTNKSILTPHIGGMSRECYLRSALKTAENALAGVRGTLDKSLIVNIESTRFHK